MNTTPSLSGPIHSESPTGEDLEYDAAFQQMQRLGEGTREQQYGDTIVAAKSPDWTDLLPLTQQLSERTRDLRVGVLLVESLTHRTGLEGAAEGLRFLASWVADLWDDLFPALDQSDGHDPFMRLNSLARLCQADRLPMLIRRSLMIERPPHVKIHCEDLLFAIDSSESTGPRSMTTMEIEAGFDATGADELQHLFDQVQSIVSSLQEIGRILEEKAGEMLWNAEALLGPLQSIRLHLKHHLQKRFQVRDAVLDEMQNQSDSDGPSSPIQNDSGLFSMMPDRRTFRVESREQAFAAIEAVTEYFARNEPSSPVPFLLKRARRIAEQNFMEILRELAPGALQECRQITGVEIEDAA